VHQVGNQYIVNSWCTVRKTLISCTESETYAHVGLRDGGPVFSCTTLYILLNLSYMDTTSTSVVKLHSYFSANSTIAKGYGNADNKLY